MWHLWFPLQHWLAIHTGTDNEAGPYYGFLSGAGSDIGEITLIGGMLAIYRKHNCHTGWCLRFGHHDFTDEATGISYRLCRKHHPAHPGRKLTRLHIARIHAENRERLVRPARRRT
jgi:hypothetical protein